MAMTLPSSVCNVRPETVDVLHTFGTVMVVALVASILSKKAYYRRIILREEEPLMYWATVASYGILAVLTLGGVLLCPLR